MLSCPLFENGRLSEFFERWRQRPSTNSTPYIIERWRHEPTSAAIGDSAMTSWISKPIAARIHARRNIKRVYNDVTSCASQWPALISMTSALVGHWLLKILPCLAIYGISWYITSLANARKFTKTNEEKQENMGPGNYKLPQKMPNGL